MSENKNSWSIQQVNDFLDQTLVDFIAANKQFVGQLITIKGRLVNVEEEISRSRYSSVYGVIIEDGDGRLEVEASKQLLSKYKNGSYVELIGQPKFNFYNNVCKNRFKAFSVNAIQYECDIQAIQSELDNLDKLKKFKPKSIPFPNKQNLKIGLIFSSASNVQIQEDFYKHLKDHKGLIEFTELPVSLSDEDALASTILQAKPFDVVILVRGGGAAENFKIFNSNKVLEAFSELDNYRVVGLGHNTDITLLDYIVDHSAFTPLDAGLHLKEQVEGMLSRTNKLYMLEEKVRNVEQQLNRKKIDYENLRIEKAKLPERSVIENMRQENANLNAKLQYQTNKKPNLNNQFLLIACLVAIFIGVIIGKFIF
ncbi:MAG: exodeoxyribonuclease VII large subunit [Acinetobacter amyesii]|uniref:exodeoxyribonuclease VII large subunit n=1 Tax=Acinetobacter amyesii TaxID=2942470 RepID=UPI003D00D5B1